MWVAVLFIIVKSWEQMCIHNLTDKTCSAMECHLAWKKNGITWISIKNIMVISFMWYSGKENCKNKNCSVCLELGCEEGIHKKLAREDCSMSWLQCWLHDCMCQEFINLTKRWILWYEDLTLISLTFKKSD